MSFYYCHVNDCRKHFRTLKLLVNHMTLQHGENKRLNLVCGLDSCQYAYNAVETFRKHVRCVHSSHWQQEIDNEHGSCADRDNYETESVGDDSSVNNDPMEIDGVQSWTNFLNDLARFVALFRLKITESYMLPRSVADSICQDVQQIFDLFQQQFVEIVRVRLQQLGVNLDADHTLHQVLSTESVFELIQAKFCTDYLFQKYLAKNMKLNVPKSISVSRDDSQRNKTGTAQNAPDTEICSNAATLTDFSGNFCGASRSQDGNLATIADEANTTIPLQLPKTFEFHYVPILNTVKNYLEQPDVWASCNVNKPQDGKLHSFTDGQIWARSGQENFVRIHLYSDEVEMCNPIGSRKTVHKLSAFYILIGNIETKYWSSLSNIHLVLLCRHSAVKEVGYRKILEPLIDDIKVLESEGVEIEIEGTKHRICGSVVTFSGDNLTSHAVGGFSTCFSSGRVCRQCLVTKLTVPDVHCETQCTLRTPENHKYHVAAVESDSSLAPVYGVVCQSPLSDLAHFSPIAFFPPDAMHDVLEGLMAVNVGVVVKSLVRRKLITVKSFNERLARFQFGSMDVANKFGPLPLDFVAKNKSLSGKAVEKWTMFRLLALLVGDVVTPDDEFWELHLLCKEICEIILAPVVDPAWLPYLQVLISRHHKLLASIAPHAFIPKIHFITHYPRLMMEYGPLRHFWVMRFEAAHQYLKRIVQRVRNFKNITSTLAKRHQAKKCFEQSANMLLLSGSVPPVAQKQVSVKQLDADLVHLLGMQSGFVIGVDEIVSSTKSLSVQGLSMKVGGYMVYDVVDVEEVPVFVHIKYILSVRGDWFVCGILQHPSHFVSHLHAWAVVSTEQYVVVRPSEMPDFQSLSSYKYGSEEVVILTHRVVGKVGDHGLT